jgi:hypothetical protein
MAWFDFNFSYFSHLSYQPQACLQQQRHHRLYLPSMVNTSYMIDTFGVPNDGAHAISYCY